MSASSFHSLKCLVFTPSLDLDAVVGVFGLIRATLPTEPPSYRVEGLQHSRVDQPTAWFAEHLTDAYLSNCVEGSWLSLGAHLLEPYFVPRGDRLIEVSVAMPNEPRFTARMFEFLQGLGPLIGAFWGEATPIEAAAWIGERLIGPAPRPRPPGAPLDGLLRHVTSLEIPAFIGWVNYWSPATCQTLGLAEDSRSELLSQVFAQVAELDGGGVVGQLTDDPLDLDRVDHRAALEDAYAAFPVIHRSCRNTGLS